MHVKPSLSFQNGLEKDVYKVKTTPSTFCFVSFIFSMEIC